MEIFILIVTAFLLFCVIAYFNGGKSKPRSNKGNARWAAKKEKKGLFNSNHKGFSLNGQSSGQLALSKSYQGVLTVSPTGQGKTASMIVGNTVFLGGSIVLTDVKGELSNLTSGIKKSQGFQVKTLDFSDIGNSLTFNPLIGANDEQIENIARILVETSEGKPVTGIWSTGACEIIEILLHCQKNAPDEYNTLHNTYYLLNNYGVDGTDLEPFINKYCKDLMIEARFTAFCAYPPKQAAGIIGTARNALKPFGSQDFAMLTSSNSIGLDTLRKQKQIIYLKINVDKMERYKTVLTLFYYRVYAIALQPIHSSDQDLFILLEEGGNLGRIPNLGRMLNVVRSNRVGTLMILQSINQVFATYQQEAKSILEALVTKCYMAGIGDEQTLNSISNMLGYETAEEKDANGKKREIARKLLEANEIRTMKKGEAIVISGETPPIKHQMMQYKDNSELMKLINQYQSGKVLHNNNTKIELIPL